MASNEDLFDEPFMLSSITLHELEHIKSASNKTEQSRYLARVLTRRLDENDDKYRVIVWNDDIEKIAVEEYKLDPTIPDNQIVATCAAENMFWQGKEEIVFVTNDLCLKNIARSIGLKVESIKTEKPLYKGYRELALNENEMAEFYENPKDNKWNFLTNEYVLLEDSEGHEVDTLKFNGEMFVPVRARSFKSDHLGTIKPRDKVQIFAMDSIAENDITVLTGYAGAGKSLLPLAYAMQQLEKGNFRKVNVVYSFEPLRNAKTLGWIKGERSEKLLYTASIGTILASKFGDMYEVRRLMETEQIDIVPTANIRGVEMDDMIFVTEAQNLDVYTTKTILQRAKEGCKIVMEGDALEQTDTYSNASGMRRIIDVFQGSKTFGCVKLKNNYRSEISRLAEMM